MATAIETLNAIKNGTHDVIALATENNVTPTALRKELTKRITEEGTVYLPVTFDDKDRVLTFKVARPKAAAKKKAAPAAVTVEKVEEVPMTPAMRKGAKKVMDTVAAAKPAKTKKAAEPAPEPEPAKRKGLKPTKGTEIPWTAKRVKAHLDSISAKQDGKELARIVILLCDNHRIADVGDLRKLLPARKWLYRNEEISVTHQSYVYEALCNYTDKLAELLRTPVGETQMFRVHYTDGTGKKSKVKEVEANSIATAVVAARKGIKDFHLEHAERV